MTNMNVFTYRIHLLNHHIKVSSSDVATVANDAYTSFKRIGISSLRTHYSLLAFDVSINNITDEEILIDCTLKPFKDTFIGLSSKKEFVDKIRDIFDALKTNDLFAFRLNSQIQSALADNGKYKIDYKIPWFSSYDKQVLYHEYSIGKDNVAELWSENSKIQPPYDQFKTQITVTIHHCFLKKAMKISGTPYEVEVKANEIFKGWDESQGRVEEAREKKIDTERKIQLALERTQNAEDQRERMRSVLIDSLSDDDFQSFVLNDPHWEIKNSALKFEERLKLVLQNSQYPFSFKHEADLDYNKENGVLIISYLLPSLDNIPSIKEIQYIKSHDTFREITLSANQHKRLYDDIVYQVVLRSINEVYRCDSDHSIQSVVFNGWIDTIDRGTGKDIRICILSLQANREEFAEINLSKVDPKSCFKVLKGVGSYQLHDYAAVAPILDIDRSDTRFIVHHPVAYQLQDTFNIAAMEWIEFEQLIREIFEKEFATKGGEVKVTQSSRDGGVDAIAFDPDPLRGGKIVIQAKRYTNIVGISSVRDLYGTVINEGASRGILVTTSDYGADSYKFAKGKPLTLLNGRNLLHLLERHGYKAKIDLMEAKKIIAEREK